MNSEEATINTSESPVQQDAISPVGDADHPSLEVQHHQHQDYTDQSTSTNDKEATMAAEQKTESSAIELSHGSAVLGNRPIGENEFAISSTMTFSGIRPIGVSTLAVYDTMMGGRPIEASDLAVVDTDSLPGHRPIFASTLTVVDADTLPEHRPIAASPAFLMHGSPTLPNNRPIASNAPDLGAALMGFLD